MNNLLAQVVVTLTDGFRLDVAIEIPAGQTHALLGPNGAGKTTLVRALAGLQPLTDGLIRLGDAIWDEPAIGAFVPTELRRVGVVFQDYLLFPHLTVEQNIAFGLHGLPTAEREARVAAQLSASGLVGLAHRRPAELSGGEAQRVALARALITEPQLLIMDEPMAALDVSTRGTMRRHLDDQLGGLDAIPRLLITHEPTEAFLLADRIHVLESGQITATGTPDDIRNRPRTPYAADLAGWNLLRGTAQAGIVTVDQHQLVVADTHTEGPVLARVHPRAVALYPDRPTGSPRNTWQTTISRVEDLGERIRVQLGSPLPVTAEVTPGSVRELGLEAGRTVWASIKATEIDLIAG